MKYKCEVCGEEFDDINEAKNHEDAHALKEPAGVDEKVKLLEEHVKELQIKVKCLEREKKSLEDRIIVLESERLYHFPSQPPKWPEYWWTCDKKDKINYVVTPNTTGPVKDFPGINIKCDSTWWNDGDDGK